MEEIIRIKRFWVVRGCSWAGRFRRNAPRLDCGHRHKTREGCVKCVARMRRERPGKYQDYRPFEMMLHWIRMARTVKVTTESK